MNYKVWQTRTGDKINVTKMTTQHIINTIRCIENGKIGFSVFLGFTGDGQGDGKIYDEDTYTKEQWLKTFKDELKKRGCKNGK